MPKVRKYLAVQDECSRCGLCYNGLVRFSCGHSGCAWCVATGQCPTCSPILPSPARRPFDGPHTKTKNSSDLPSLQDTLQIDEYQRLRISEKLRVEKELFPECIQAPSKYFNKKKSLDVSKRGEEQFSMDKSRTVQEWLNKLPKTFSGSDSRSPFSDLNVNTHHKQAAHSTPLKDTQKENITKLPTRQSNRKRSRLEQSPSTTSQLSLENYFKPLEKGVTKKGWGPKRMEQEFDTKHVKSREGGKQRSPDSDLENSEAQTVALSYTIEDTQDEIVDKDKLALLELNKTYTLENSEPTQDEIVDKGKLALLELNKTYTLENSEPVILIEDTEFPQKKSHVPFLKKSYPFQNCAQCKDTLNNLDRAPDNISVKGGDASITVETESFIATISVVNINPPNKHSTAVQTDVVEPFLGFEQAQTETTSLIAKMKEYTVTKDIATVGELHESDAQKTSCPDVTLKNQEKEANGNRVQEDNTLNNLDRAPDNISVKGGDASITVETESFIATISVVNINPPNKHSTAVQTDVVEPFLGFEQAQTETTSLIAKMKEYTVTKDIATVGELHESDAQKTSCPNVTLKNQEKEANGNRVQEDNMQAAFGHSSEQAFGVLSALDRVGFRNKRPRVARGATPDSNNSSDKENCDPNRRKKGDAKKKKKNK